MPVKLYKNNPFETLQGSPWECVAESAASENHFFIAVTRASDQDMGKLHLKKMLAETRQVFGEYCSGSIFAETAKERLCRTWNELFPEKSVVETNGFFARKAVYASAYEPVVFTAAAGSRQGILMVHYGVDDLLWEEWETQDGRRIKENNRGRNVKFEAPDNWELFSGGVPLRLQLKAREYRLDSQSVYAGIEFTVQGTPVPTVSRKVQEEQLHADIRNLEQEQHRKDKEHAALTEKKRKLEEASAALEKQISALEEQKKRILEECQRKQKELDGFQAYIASKQKLLSDESNAGGA